MPRPTKSALPGAALLAAYIERRSMKRAEFARLASEHGAKVDRVTLVNLLDGHTTRVSVPVALAIERATDGEIPVESWAPLAKRVRKAA